MPKVGRDIFGAARELHRVMDGNLRERGITSPQIQILGYLDWKQSNGEPCNQVELCYQCGNTRPSSVTSVLQTLEQRGLIERRTGTDAREKIVSLTQEGIRLAQECKLYADRVERTLLKGFSAEEAENFCKFLQKAIENLQDFAIREKN